MRNAIAAIHCAACTGRERRRDIAHVVIPATTGELSVVTQPGRDKFGRSTPPIWPPTCPTHGVLASTGLDGLAIYEAFRATHRLQHIALAPKASSADELA